MHTHQSLMGINISETDFNNQFHLNHNNVPQLEIHLDIGRRDDTIVTHRQADQLTQPKVKL